MSDLEFLSNCITIISLCMLGIFFKRRVVVMKVLSDMEREGQCRRTP